MNSSHTPIALTIAGSDSGGGAGIQADIKTFSALGVFGSSAITSLTAQNTLGVQHVFAVDPVFVQHQITSVLSDLSVDVIKSGMLANAEIILAVSESLRKYSSIPFVLDPVMVATSGDRLLTEDAVDYLIKHLLPLATIVTPNLHEAAALLGDVVASDRDAMIAQGKKILDMGAKAVLMKGGHAANKEAMDLLITAESVEEFSSPRIETRNTHGTGCTLASAIAANIAKGFLLKDAVKEAKEYLFGALLAADKLQVGEGSGPVHHFFKFY